MSLQVNSISTESTILTFGVIAYQNSNVTPEDMEEHQNSGGSYQTYSDLIDEEDGQIFLAQYLDARHGFARLYGSWRLLTDGEPTWSLVGRPMEMNNAVVNLNGRDSGLKFFNDGRAGTYVASPSTVSAVHSHPSTRLDFRNADALAQPDVFGGYESNNILQYNYKLVILLTNSEEDLGRYAQLV